MDIEVVRDDLATVRTVERPPAPLVDGQARIGVDRFGFSANNVTYGVVGDLLRYWDFFPASPAQTGDGRRWGRIPVWGFGEVVESRSEDVSVGERLFGYLPMSDELVIVPGRPQERTVSDVSPHRADLPSAYNSFQRCATDPLYRADREDLQMLLYPLFFTSFVMDDFLVDGDDFGAEQVVVSSASAKTSIGAAFLAHGRGRRVVALTSPGNREFTASLGVYDTVLTYGEVDRLDVVPSVYVDVAGDADLLRAVHTHLGEVLAHSMTVGDTHWDAPSPTSREPVPGPRPEFLFAPTRIAKRIEDWGPDELNARVAGAWIRFTDWVPTWLTIRQLTSADELIAVYRRFLEGRVDPSLGYACTLTAAPVGA